MMKVFGRMNSLILWGKEFKMKNTQRYLTFLHIYAVHLSSHTVDIYAPPF